jgi:hypothetical protein
MILLISASWVARDLALASLFLKTGATNNKKPWIHWMIQSVSFLGEGQYWGLNLGLPAS